MTASYLRADALDQLVLDGECILLYEDRYVRLGPLGTHLVAVTTTPRTLDELADALIAALGAPAEGNAVKATRDAVAALIAQGVLREVDHD